jgi:hypothetical protein
MYVCWRSVSGYVTPCVSCVCANVCQRHVSCLLRLLLPASQCTCLSLISHVPIYVSMRLVFFMHMSLSCISEYPLCWRTWLDLCVCASSCALICLCVLFSLCLILPVSHVMSLSRYICLSASLASYVYVCVSLSVCLSLSLLSVMFLLSFSSCVLLSLCIRITFHISVCHVYVLFVLTLSFTLFSFVCYTASE